MLGPISGGGRGKGGDKGEEKEVLDEKCSLPWGGQAGLDHPPWEERRSAG